MAGCTARAILPTYPEGVFQTPSADGRKVLKRTPKPLNPKALPGVQFDVMPKPLASIDTTVCWPKGRPDGQARLWQGFRALGL